VFFTLFVRRKDLVFRRLRILPTCSCTFV
jgi:hypothetical protein